MPKRLFIVSNRLPITVDDSNIIKQGSGGLVTAMNSFLVDMKNQSFSTVFWAGIPGCSSGSWGAATKNISDHSFTYLPVFVSRSEYHGYYNGHANSVLWPLFHYFPSYADYNLDSFNFYTKVNEHFAETLLKSIHPGDTVWIHDYHLLPLTAMLRKEMPQLTIGFFLHIPFPSFEIFRLLPRKWQETLLKGLLGADLIGLHTIDYAAHLLQCFLMILGLDNDHNIIHFDNRLIKVDVFPISIDFKKFNEAYDNEKVLAVKKSICARMGERKIIFSIDRLDYSKGVHNRLKAYEFFLTQNPHYLEKVVFIMVMIPSRDTIPKYAERKRMIDELISDINSTIGNIHWMPVIYQYNSLEFEEMVGLYSACDLALITPLRDGMNLVAKEFVASRKDNKGVLVLSEMAGAARELTDALLINPNDILELAQKIKEGLEMDLNNQTLAMESMQQRIQNYDIKAWAEDFMSELENIKLRQQNFQIKFLDEFSKRTMYHQYRIAKKRLLLLDYDGTLVSFTSNPENAIPDKELLQLISNLCIKKQNEVFIISGRNSAWLEKCFGKLPVNLIAEHGARYRWKTEEWVTDIQTHSEWKEQVHNIMEMYVRRCVNSFIEEKDFSMVWHYRDSIPDHGKLRSAELKSELNEFIHNRHLQVLMGNKIVEVRQSGINKGTFIKRIIDKVSYDFIFAAGDDRTDEDMFQALLGKKDTFTIKVGPEASYAQYNLHNPQMIISFLEGLDHIH